MLQRGVFWRKTRHSPKYRRVLKYQHLLYRFEVCNLYKKDLYSLDFVVNRFFMKLFLTSDISVITYCREMFQFDLPSAILKKRAEKFDSASFN